MRSAPALIAALLMSTVAACAPNRTALPQNGIALQTNPRPWLSATVTPRSGDARGAPILQAVTVRTDVSNGQGMVFDLVPDFHFIAPNGNATLIHRELVDTSGNFSPMNFRDVKIIIPAAAQKKGAVESGGWRCGLAQYYVTIRAVIMDADGNRSNPVEYTIHCNGG